MNVAVVNSSICLPDNSENVIHFFVTKVVGKKWTVRFIIAGKIHVKDLVPKS